MILKVAGIEVTPASVPPLDPEFVPAALFNRRYRELASAVGKTPLRLALEGGDGAVSTFDTSVISSATDHLPASLLYVERIVKFLLWQRGGWKLYVGGPSEIGEHIKAVYSPRGVRSFDCDFMSKIYERPFEVIVTTPDAVPESRESTR